MRIRKPDKEGEKIIRLEGNKLSEAKTYLRLSASFLKALTSSQQPRFQLGFLNNAAGWYVTITLTLPSSKTLPRKFVRVSLLLRRPCAAVKPRHKIAFG